jgi:hypothetical protein
VIERRGQIQYIVGVYGTLFQSDTVQTYGPGKEDTRPVGFGLHKKPKDLSPSDREECGYDKGVGVYDTLFQSDTVQEDVLVKEDPSSVGVGRREKPKDLSTSERLMMWYVHERWTDIFDGQPPSRSSRDTSTTYHGLP